MRKEILIIRLSSIGDVIHCTPVARSLKMAWPNSRITWLVGEVCADLLKYNPYIDEVLVWPREKFDKYIAAKEFQQAYAVWRELKAILPAKKFYAVLDIQGLFLTGMIARQVQAERYIGLSGSRELNWLFMSETAPPLGRHVTDRYLGVLTKLGIAEVDHDMTLVVPDEIKQCTRALLADGGLVPGDKYAVLVPGTTWLSKNWPTESFVETGYQLANDLRIVLCGGKAETSFGLKIAAAVRAPVLNLIGRTSLLEMAAVIEQAAVVITGDTGPLHMAAALKVPTVAVFGPTDPDVYAPQGKGNVVVRNKLDCSFCHKRCCPQGEAICMSGIEPQKVVEAAYSVLNRRTEKRQQPLIYPITKQR